MLLKEERDFYGHYAWALMPFLTFRQVMERLNYLIHEDIDSMPEWCKREWNVNLYMLSSSAADLADDYLVRGVTNFSKLPDYVPLTGGAVNALRQLSLFKCRIRGTVKDKGMDLWRKQWAEWLISVCNLLVSGQVPEGHDQTRLIEAGIPLLRKRFPNGLMKMRMRIPAAYRSQDLTHHDFLSLSRKYCEKNADCDVPHVVIGLRSAGSYGAPLVCAYLRKAGYKHVSYMTIRPKSFVHPRDELQISGVCKARTKVILVDEPPGTGKTLSRSIEILKMCGVDTGALTILAPTHPGRRNWADSSLRSAFGNIGIISLAPEEWYKENLLKADAFRDAVKPYFAELGYGDIEVEETEHIVQINNQLGKNTDGAFHVRLKRVFSVFPKNGPGLHAREGPFIMAKSVGWGWLGYHAALAADRLEGFTPRVYGVRNGMMFLDWIADENGWEEKQSSQEQTAQRLSAYISRRTNLLRLDEDPMRFLSSYQDSGLQSIALILSKAFGPKVSKMKRGWVRERLERLTCTIPAFLDSRMTRDEWIGSGASMVKVDFEHHGFSKTASHNIVDPAYDIATAALTFQLLDSEMEGLVSAYVHDTGDASINERLIYYKLLSGCEDMSQSLNRLNMAEHDLHHTELNYRYMYALKFLGSETTRYVSQFCSGESKIHWGTPMFVMDVDGVLEKNIFGFPSITANGIRALSLLREHDVCSVVNTARALEEVKEYCGQYGFAGGIGEYGSVIWDAVEQETHVLVPPEALEELAVLREALGNIPGIFVNPFYHHSIRAYIFNMQGTRPVPDAAIGRLFRSLGIKHLTARKSDIDTAILARTVDKGKALLRLREMKGVIDGDIAAIGDTDADLPQLLCADRGFLVGNSSADLKRTARKFGITVLGSNYQTGLLDAVNIFLHRGSSNCDACKAVLKKSDANSNILWDILCIADRSPLEQWYHAFDRKTLEMFQE